MVDYLDNTIKNTIDYGYQNKDFFLIRKVSAFENLSKTGNENLNLFILKPLLKKILLMSESLGIVDLKSDLLVRNYDVDKQLDIISNEFKWVSNSWVNKFGFENEICWII